MYVVLWKYFLQREFFHGPPKNHQISKFPKPKFVSHHFEQLFLGGTFFLFCVRFNLIRRIYFLVAPSYEWSDLSTHYGICMYVCCPVEIFFTKGISSWTPKKSLDLKNSKTKICFTSFCVTFIGGNFFFVLCQVQSHQNNIFFSHSIL